MVTIVYWSGTGNTEAMANEIEAAAKAAGADVEKMLFDDTTVDAVAGKDVILLGCPAMGGEELEETVVEPFFAELSGKLSGKKVGLFGSYGWGGQANGQIEEELKKCGFDICLETLKIQYIPSEEQLKELSEKIKSLK